MSWEWSHSPKAYEKGRQSLAKKGIGWLIICLAEWRSTDFNNPETMEGPELDVGRYEEELDAIKAEDYELHQADCTRKSRQERLAELIWEQAEQLRTCTNGGHEAWVCPYGCHTVAW